MPLLFSYGTLQQEEVQLSTFGRRLEGHADELPGFERSRVAQHDNVTFNGRDDSRVAGMAFDVTDVELSSADSYERTASYARTAVTLSSGRRAWVYRYVGGME